MRYFFDVFLDGDLVPDNEGQEFETLEAVQQEAIQCALELKREFPREGAAAIGNIVEVRCEDGRRVFALPIHQHHYRLETVP